MGGGLHVAIIMDGNGRWASARALARAAGHREGARALRRTVEAAPTLGIDTLTVYAFSADNWSRPADEVSWLMRLFRRYLRTERRSCVENGVQVAVIGRRDRLPRPLVDEIETTERATAGGERLLLRVAVDYSARDAMLRAAMLARNAGVPPDREGFGRFLAAVDHSPPTRAVDLLIRTGGEQRLSDFLLWESAYAELYFTDVMWPDFEPAHLADALDEFNRRDRRFGGRPEAEAAEETADAAGAA